MDTRGVAFAHEVTRDELRSLIVGTLGGKWQDHPSLDQGLVERGASIVWASIESVTDFESYEVEELQQELGAPPVALVVVRVGRAPGSDSLADLVINRMIEVWKGARVPYR